MTAEIRHLLDPAIAIPGEEPTTDFWERFISWERDTRVRLGAATYAELSALYATEVCARPSVYIPGGFGKSVHRAVLSLLSRSSSTESAVPKEEVGLVPPYAGQQRHDELLRSDLSSDGFAEAVVLGTVVESWPQATATVIWLAPPPAELTLIYEPNTPTAEETSARRGAAVNGLQVLIVGGQVDQRILESISKALPGGLSVRWEPCERHKPPRNLNSQIRGLKDKFALVICITGRVGHSTSGKVKERCSAEGVELREVETAGHVLAEVEYFADSRLADGARADGSSP